MAFVTLSQARTASRVVARTEMAARTEVRKSAATSMMTWFDIFLSHSLQDAEVVNGLKVLIEAEGLTVYIDWVDDPQLDRSEVTAATAEILRQRMKHCRMLVYASSPAASESKWMPWELGYFDAMHPDKVAIMPIVANASDGFLGREYLGLYPTIERVAFQDGTVQLAHANGRIAHPLKATARHT